MNCYVFSQTPRYDSAPNSKCDTGHFARFVVAKMKKKAGARRECSTSPIRKLDEFNLVLHLRHPEKVEAAHAARDLTACCDFIDADLLHHDWH